MVKKLSPSCDCLAFSGLLSRFSFLVCFIPNMRNIIETNREVSSFLGRPMAIERPYVAKKEAMGQTTILATVLNERFLISPISGLRNLIKE